MNRRRTIERRLSLRRLLKPSGNRRLKPKKKERTVGSESAADTGRGETLRQALRRSLLQALHLLLFAVKVTVVVVVLLGVLFGGYYTYSRAVTSDYFNVSKIEIKSTRRAPIDQVRRLLESARGRNLLTLDLSVLRRAVLSHPWVRAVRIERELPDKIRVFVTEHKAQALLLMGHLYLVNGDGKVFKRAEPDECDGMPVITGISRMSYLNDPRQAQERIDAALAALDRYYGKVRPPLSEVHVGAGGEITLHLRQGGVAVRAGTELNDERLEKMDAVWAALGPDARRARVLFLDNTARKDRVTVRMGDY